MRYENMINFIAELRHVAFCRYLILCLSFLVGELWPPEVKKRVCVATHSRFSLKTCFNIRNYLRCLKNANMLLLFFTTTFSSITFFFFWRGLYTFSSDSVLSIVPTMTSFEFPASDLFIYFIYFKNLYTG